MEHSPAIPVAPGRPARWHRRVLALAFPIVLANLTQPLLSAVDTAVAGHLPGRNTWAAWRSGRVLQFRVLGVRLPAHGHHRPGRAGARRGRCAGTAANVARALLLALAIGLACWCCSAGHPPHPGAAGGERGGDRTAEVYCHARIWSAPFALANYWCWARCWDVSKCGSPCCCRCSSIWSTWRRCSGSCWEPAWRGRDRCGDRPCRHPGLRARMALLRRLRRDGMQGCRR